MQEKILALAAMGKILKKSGAKRVSDGAKEELRIALEKNAEDISKKAVKFALYSGRKTIKSEDVKSALKD